MGSIHLIDDPHLIEIGDGVALADDVSLETVYEEPGSGYVISNRVKVGKDCIVGVQAEFGPGTIIGDRAWILPHASIKGKVDSEAVMAGVPASKLLDLSSLPPGAAAATGATTLTPYCRDECFPRYVITGLLQSFTIPLVSAFINLLLVITAAYPPNLFLFWLLSSRGPQWSITAAQATLPICYLGFSLCVVVIVILQKWILRWKTKQGLRLRGPLYHIRAHTLVLQTYAAINTLDHLCGSVFVPLYLRLFGGKVHPTAYIDSLKITDPDRLVVGKNAIIDSHAAMVCNVMENDRKLVMGDIRIMGGARLGAAASILRDCVVGRGAELADGAFLPPSQHLRPGGRRVGADVKRDLYDDDDGEDEEKAPSESLITLALRI